MNDYPPYDELLTFAEGLADISRQLLSKAFVSRPSIQIKDDNSYVTQFDKSIEEIFRNIIGDKYKDHGILGEEFGSINVDAEFVWVLDPIDGTAQFIAGLPVFGTLIGLAWKGRPFIGVIDHPATNDRWGGVADGFAMRNEKSISTSKCQDFESAFVTCSNPDFMSDEELDKFARIRETATYVQYGGSCFAYGLLASGRTDLAIDSSFAPFDFFANAAVISGAGGILSNWDGEEVTLNWTGGILAAGDKSIHQKAVSILAV